MQSNFATLRIRIFLENTAMTALVIAEHDNHQLLPATCHAITAAAQCANEVHVLVAGHNAAVVAQATAQLAGVDKVLHADAPMLANPLAELMAIALSLTMFIKYRKRYGY